MPHGHLIKLISRVKRKHNLDEDAVISTHCIRQRVKKGCLEMKDAKPGPKSPLQMYELDFVKIMVQMAKMRQALSPSEGISLINSLIEGTQGQKGLIAFKKQSSYGDSGSVGIGYWRRFKERCEHLICSKKGQKYELDRDKWTTYANFSNMYIHIYDEMVEAGVATLLDEPEWQDMNGVRCLESDALGCKVTHHLTHPEMCVVMDEVGANTNQKGDGKIGGRLLVCAKGTVPQEKINTKDKHWTLLGLTALNGDAIMCVAIFAGKRPQAVVETGYDVFATQEGKVSEESFFDRNSKGTGKTFPGGPTCIFQGKEVPCLTRWSPKGSITGDILVDIVSTLDTLSVFDRSEGRKPFLLLDGYGSRFALNFVQYVTDPLREWAVCIGVPYGTSLWQVGDSSEQNGSYKIELARGKNELIKKKSKKQMKLTIERYEIIPLINSAWSKSFARPLSNRKAIAARGWNPLNRNILLDETLRATMAEGDDRTEHILDIVPSQFVYIPPTTTLTTAAVSTIPASTKCPPLATATAAVSTIPSSPECPPLTTASSPVTNPPVERLNYSNGVAAMCLDSMVAHDDLMQARERIRREQSEGKTISERIKEQKGAVTAGKLFNVGVCRIGRTVFDLVNENATNVKKQAEEKGVAAREALEEKIREANEIKALQKAPDKLTNAQLRTLLAPLKRHGDAAIPTKKDDLLRRLTEWTARGPLQIEEEVAVVMATAAREMREQDRKNEEDDEIGLIEEL